MTIESAMGERTRRGAGALRRLRWRVLGVPLIAKLIGTNVVIVAVALAAHTALADGGSWADTALVLVGLAAASLVSAMLVRIALRPVRSLEALAQRIQAGDFSARAAPSPFADAALAGLGETINDLLDSLAAERRRIQDLGAQVVSAQDQERGRVARELHDSIAQTLAALRFQLAAASNESDGALRDRLLMATDLAGSAMEEVKNVSYSLHPRVAEDLGLEAALGTLARQVETRLGIDVRVAVEASGPAIPPKVTATLFRIAQASLRSIEVQSDARTASISVVSRDSMIRMEVSHDGAGFDPATLVSLPEYSSIAALRDRLMLAGGTLKIESNPNGGKRVIAELQTLKAAS